MNMSLAVLSHGTICFAGFGKIKFGIFLEFLLWPVLGVKGSRNTVLYLRKAAYVRFN